MKAGSVLPNTWRTGNSQVFRPQGHFGRLLDNFQARGGQPATTWVRGLLISGLQILVIDMATAGEISILVCNFLLSLLELLDYKTVKFLHKVLYYFR